MSLFDYPKEPHVRKHGPSGYTHYRYYKPWLRDEFDFRCVYCLFREQWYPNQQGSFSVEHSLPKAVFPYCDCCYDNLLLACVKCNALKSDHLIGCDPCKESFSQHLEAEPDGRLRAKTTKGARLIDILRLNRSELVTWRKMLTAVLPVLELSTRPEDAQLLRFLRGFPVDLPNLRAERPPKGNSKPHGVADCHFCRQASGTLPNYY